MTLKQQAIQLGKRDREIIDVDDIDSAENIKKIKTATASDVDGASKSTVLPSNKNHNGMNAFAKTSASKLLMSPTWPIIPALPSFDVASAFSNVEGKMIKKEPGLDLLYFKPFLKAPVRQTLFKYLLEEFPWYRVSFLISLVVDLTDMIVSGQVSGDCYVKLHS